MPRALTWTTKPPQEPGYYFFLYRSVNGDMRVGIGEVFSRDHWRHKDWEKRYGKIPCLLAAANGVGPASRFSRFAGPIPMPKEPTP